MKIEICEQMLQSWLFSCRLCEVVQTNWVVSPLRPIDPTTLTQVEAFMVQIQDTLNQILDDEMKAALQEQVDEENTAKKPKRKTKVKKLNIFKNSKPAQFVRQCEIDVVGVKLDEGITERIYLVDTAFHKAGLGYADAVSTVVKKILRALLVAAIVFGKSVPITVAFASPQCSDTVARNITDVLNALAPICKAQYPDMDVELYFNERFATDIYLPLKKELSHLNNDNDLFMRALNLAAVAEKHLPTAPAAPAVPAAPAAPTVSASKPNNKKLVFGILNDLAKTGKLTPALLSDLQKPAFANSTFKMPTYPILLKEADFPYHGYERCRFYSGTITLHGTPYLVCSQWIPDRITLLQAWYDTL